jgi:hypothetical protein
MMTGVVTYVCFEETEERDLMTYFGAFENSSKTSPPSAPQRLNHQLRRRCARVLLLACDEVAIAHGKGFEHT